MSVKVVALPDKHTITATPARGPGAYDITNPRTGRVVERVGSFGDALAAQAKWDTAAVKNQNIG